MKPKTYTLELTAEELEALNRGHLRGYRELREVNFRLQELNDQVAADRDREDLRLPWKVEGPNPMRNGFVLVNASGLCVGCCGPTAGNRLASAAPELLEAVQAAYANGPEGGRNWHKHVRPKIERALRKVETGVPE